MLLKFLHMMAITPFSEKRSSNYMCKAYKSLFLEILRFRQLGLLYTMQQVGLTYDGSSNNLDLPQVLDLKQFWILNNKIKRHIDLYLLFFYFHCYFRYTTCWSANLSHYKCKWSWVTLWPNSHWNNL